MNWNIVSAIADFMAAFAVIVSLVYLSIQIKSGARDFRATIRDSAFRSLEDWNHVIMAEETLAWIFQEGCRDIESLNEKERTRYVHIMYSFFKMFENIYIHVLDGTVGQEAWDTNCQILYAYALQPGAQHYWNLRKGVFDPRFCEIVESSKSSDVPAGHVVSGLSSDNA